MKSIYSISLTVVTTILIFAACAKDATKSFESDNLKLPQSVLDYSLPKTSGGIVKSAHFRDNVNNPITNNGATLGRVLFYDKKLSLNNLVACGSCHHQDKAFSDGNAQSVGFKGGLTTRNAPALNNPCMDFAYFWDTRTKNLEDLTLQPISNHLEMGMENLDDLTKKLAKVNYYPELFKNAFGSTEISKERISSAMAQFIRSIVSVNSKYDDAMKNNLSPLTTEEKRGLTIFQSTHCMGCHSGPNLNGWSGGGDTRNIGLDMQPKDLGASNGRFKVPSLRNVALTAPYMHDGRFKTLEEVVEHYNSRVQSDPNLDFQLKDGYPNFNAFGGGPGLPTRLNLSDEDKKALVAFLKTLTDNKFVADERYSNPFK
jgi:cytochrome c peroxidase